MTTEYMTIPKLAREMGISDATVRRYIRNYPRFFKPMHIDGWDQYPVDETLKILKVINENSSAGQRKGEVLPILLREFSVVEDSPNTDKDSVSEVSGGTMELGPKTLRVLTDLSDVLTEIRDVLIKISEK